MSVVASSAMVGKTVVVVGAGLAGLAAAYRLHQAGVDVEVYEARGRVGGRVFSVMVDGEAVDLGGHNITDGGDATTMRALIAEMGLLLHESKSPMNLKYYTGNEFLPLKQLLQEKKFDPVTLREQLTALAKQHKNMRGVLDALFDRNESVYAVLATILAAYEGAL